MNTKRVIVNYTGRTQKCKYVDGEHVAAEYVTKERVDHWGATHIIPACLACGEELAL